MCGEWHYDYFDHATYLCPAYMKAKLFETAGLQACQSIVEILVNYRRNHTKRISFL